jgi:hypothetical protein
MAVTNLYVLQHLTARGYRDSCPQPFAGVDETARPRVEAFQHIAETSTYVPILTARRLVHNM